MVHADLKKTLRAVVQEHGAECVSQTLSELEFELRDALLSMVQKYGFEQVGETLRSIAVSEKELGDALQGSALVPEAKARKRRSGARNTAPQYVAKMNLPPATEVAVAELADRFQHKTFLPTFGDIANFCQAHGIDVPASRTRANSIPRVFKYIASMEPEHIQRMIDRRMFSGPARLGPIADAIRRNGRAARASETEAGVSSG